MYFITTGAGIRRAVNHTRRRENGKKTELFLAVGMICASAFRVSQNATTIDDLMQAGTEGAEEETAERCARRRAGNHFVLNNQPDGIDPNVTNNSFATPFLINCSAVL